MQHALTNSSCSSAEAQYQYTPNINKYLRKKLDRFSKGKVNLVYHNDWILQQSILRYLLPIPATKLNVISLPTANQHQYELRPITNK